ncbi:MAG: IS5 family transposase [Gillisia sp.]
MQAKVQYKIRNWANYNRALIQRGSINIWVEEESLEKWYSSFHTCQAGRPEKYSDDAILMLLMLREVFKLTLRSLQGFTKSLFKIMGLDLSVPSYSQVSRRAQTLQKRIRRLIKGKKSRHIIFDSTGLKVYGEGEWKVKVHGKSKRRTWRKFHIGIDAETQDILCCELTENSRGDAEVAEKMLDSFKTVKSARGDGAYDGQRFRKKVHEKGGRCIVPPPKGATYKGADDEWEKERDQSLAAINGFGGGEDGRRLWKICSQYHRRSLVETAMFRLKRMFGDGLKSRSIGAQKTEVICKSLVINKMNKLGMPKGKWLIKAA